MRTDGNLPSKIILVCVIRSIKGAEKRLRFLVSILDENYEALLEPCEATDETDCKI